ncbi:MAG: hypothetical protein ABFD89_25285 [Bryobacteraceae bacterium]
MVARTFSVRLKPDEGPGFSRAVDQEVVPILRRFAGFRDQITLMSADGRHAVGIVFWDRKQDVDPYIRDGYPEVIKALQKYLEDVPIIATYSVTNWTTREIFAAAAP